MKPKTKSQKQVAELSAKLPALTDKQRDWGIEHCFEKIGYLRKKSVWCTECGKTWEPEEGSLVLQLTGAVCPHCGKQLKIELSRKRKDEYNEYYTIINTFHGYQILRHYVARKTCCVGYPAHYEINEAVQSWITPKGEEILMSRCTQMSFYYIDLWNWNSPMEIRNPSTNPTKYSIYAKYIYPIRHYIPNLVRNGFKGYFHGISPNSLFKMLLTNPKAETLLKAKQYSLLLYMKGYGHVISKFWPSIRICIRNNYIVKDASLWADYMNFIDYFHLDTNSPKYVCPANLEEEHDKLLKRKRRITEKEELERRCKEAVKWEKEYQKQKSKFFGLHFGNDNIIVSVLQSVKEFAEEGTSMHHCVFQAEYFKKPDSLILSAKTKAGERIETIELSLKTFEIIQSRGSCNKNTPFHDEILNLVQQNINLIKKAA